MDIKIFNSPDDIAEAVSNQLIEDLNKRAGKKEKFYLALSGGSTPKILFKKMAEKRHDFKWVFLHIFWVDERSVPPGDDESNFGMTKKFLLDKVEIPDKNIHRIRGEEDPDKEAERYADEIKNAVPLNNNFPHFDLVFLGLGEDGHTASLFPGSVLNPVADGIAGVAYHPGKKTKKRISLTREVINNSKKIIFLVTGKSKAEIISKILKENGAEYPASEIIPVNGNLQWFIDKEAATNL